MSEENDVEEKTIVFIPAPWPEYLDLSGVDMTGLENRLKADDDDE